MSHIHHLGHIAKHLEHTRDPAEGAMGGAAAAGIGIPAALALGGLALTPLGWAVALGGGAVAGAVYVKNKLK